MFSLEGLFDKVGGFRQFFRNLFGSNKFGTQEYDIKKLSDAEIAANLIPLYMDLTAALKSSNVHAALQKIFNDMQLAVESAGKELMGEFAITNGAVKENIKIFASVLDDREKFKNDVMQCTASLEVLERINVASANFMKLWDEVSNPITSA